jgi:adenylate cyclase
MPLVLQLKDRLVPSLDAEALRLATDAPTLSFKSDEGQGGLFGGMPGIAAFAAPGRGIPTMADGSFWIAYAAPTGARNLSALDLADGKFAPGSLARTIVYFGAPDDLVPTPDGLRTRVSVHAEALENILTGSALRRPSTALQAELICLAVIGLGVVLLFARFGVWPAGAFAVLSIAAGGYASWYFYSVNHVLFDALSPSVGLALTFIAGAAARGAELASTRSRLRHMFAETLPQRAIDEIARDPSLLQLEGENRTVTYLSCGVRGFAQLSASFRDDPAAFTRLMNRILSPLMDRALHHNGSIDRLTADGFAAFWNAPLNDAEHAIHACEAAHAMTVAVAHINEAIANERRMDGTAFPLVEIGIGLSTGIAIAGGVRTHGRMAYSVNGDCTVMASRIQALSEQYGPAVIVAEDTRKAAERGFAFLEVDYIAAGPHDEPVKLYAMLGNPVVRASPKFRALLTFHEHIFQSLRTQQWGKARELIEQCRKLSGASQKLYDLHLARIAYFEENPPGENWDGVFRTILK